MAGFGSLAPDWRDAEASQALALQQADEAEAASKNRSWGDTARDVLKAPARIFGALASAPPSAEADQAAMMPETFANPLVTNLLGGAGAAVKSGATLPGDVAAGRVPMVGPDGHTSPELIHRAFDTASMAGGGSVAGALSEDAAKAGAGVNIAAHAPTFNPGLETALENSPRKVATGAQWANDLKRYGAKPEEMDWRGVTDLLAGKQTAPISRDELAAHLSGNKVDLKPVDLGTPSWDTLTGDQQRQIHDKWQNSRYPSNFDNAREYFEDVVKPNADEFSGIIPKPAKWSEYQLPGGDNYRERLLTLPTANDRYIQATEAMRAKYGDRPLGQMPMTDVERAAIDRHISDYGDNGGKFTSNHWEEPNVVVHRRSNEREMSVAPTAEEQSALDAHAAAADHLEDLRGQQGEAAREINRIAKPLRAAQDDQVFADLKSGKIKTGDFERISNEPVSSPELKAAQDRLQQLRAQEDQVRGSLPPKPDLKSVKTLHAEEIQSDWHQAGAKQGYITKYKPEELTEAPKGSFAASDPDRFWYVKAPDNMYQIPKSKYASFDEAKNYIVSEKNKTSGVPDGPFKDSWHRLALNDMVREAAEKGFDRISWTAGDSQATHPKNIGGSQRQIENAEKGMRAFYDDKLVNAANKIGKPHGVSVQKGTIPKSDVFSAEEGNRLMARDGISREQWRDMSQPERDKLIAGWEEEGHDIWHMDIPQSLKDQALKKGFSMFEDSAASGAPVAAAGHFDQHAPLEWR